MASPQQTGSGPSETERKDQLMGLVLGLIGVLMFSGTLPATRLAVESFHPWFLTFGRAALAAIAAAVCLSIMRKKFPKQHLSGLLFVGVTLVFGFPGFMALAMLTVPSSHGGVVLGILPLATAIFAALFAGERPSPLFWLCGVIGSLIIVVFALRNAGGSIIIGDLWLLAAGLTASSGYVISGKLSHHMPGWEVICWALVLCSPLAFVGAWWFWDTSYLSAPTTQNLAFLYVAFGSMFLGFFAWNQGLKLGGLAKIGQLQLLQTFLTLAIAALVLGEAVTLETWGFALAVLAVVVLGRNAKVAR